MWIHYGPQKLALVLMIILVLTGRLAAQQTQTVRGTVVDQQSKKGIAAVSIHITGTYLSAITDSSGSFSINKVPVGRIGIQASHIGYEPAQLNNMVVESGKETYITLELLEKLVVTQDEIVVTGRRESMAGQQMATVSATGFNAEDTRRFAGSRNDVARMASNFAGVNSVNDGRNDIIIRGNSPQGLLWRLEGVDIPNPNHFGSLGATGGPVGMLNNNVIGQSVFYTGAFPAQFGNATAGVFDLSLRKGNSNRHEFTGQVGFNGLELGAEGPFSKNSKASYLIYYRYSIPGLLKSLGVNVGTGAAVPTYQDISFKVDLPTKKAGQFSLFGIGGNSKIDFKGELKDTSNFYNDPYSNLYNSTKMGVAGLKHTYFFNNTTSYTFTLAATGTNVTTRQDSLDADRLPHKNYRQNGNEWRYMASLVLNKKISARDRFTIGLILDQLHYSYTDSLRDADHGFIPVLEEKDHTELLRGYAQWQHRFSNRLTLNTGVYGQYLALNKKGVAEGRAGLRYAFTPGGTATLAYGTHHQMQTLMTYFHETPVNGSFVQTNRNLGFTQSNHIVAGWEQVLKANWKYKLEAYTQLLNNIPVQTRPTDWSAVNLGAGYETGLEDSLVNKGKGYNYGAELTVEKPFAGGYYFLSTVSVFNSKYKGSNGGQHNTAFNGNYVVNALGGKEWQLKGIHTIAVDMKLTAAGGKRYTPINEAASKQANRVIYYEDRSFELRTKAYFRMDIKLTYRMNSKGYMQEFFIDFQNVTNHKNVFNQWYDSRSASIRTQNQLGFWPNFNYRIQF
ncbi:carboxypeptidase regulatory-like domain-containing protein [Terrimonas rubra]|uniref:Carboxypeptidase regulatory-like domain-containing protein n=1 Tax=Terrimonas rubra TaxID=1035890 RepID=A0ABW6A536_9BACT